MDPAVVRLLIEAKGCRYLRWSSSAMEEWGVLQGCVARPRPDGCWIVRVGQHFSPAPCRSLFVHNA
jgi:hypothetical protein